MAQNFSCPNFAYGLRNCNYSDVIDPECSVGPHVAGVRCIQSKFSIVYGAMIGLIYFLLPSEQCFSYLMQLVMMVILDC